MTTAATTATNKNTQKLDIYDTTLRDGTQGEGVNLSLADKLAITQALDDFGVDYIEGGWPGSNPKDEAYFEQVQDLKLHHAKISAFGSTRRAKVSAAEDANLQKLVAANADVTCIFGKTWDFHVIEALRIELSTNIEMIADSVAYLKQQTGKTVFYDAEHFFDGYKANPEYALDTVEAAWNTGAECLILCDTNGGSLPDDITAAVQSVYTRIPDARIGIHAHNDGGLAVANTLAALAAGCVHVQGTVNGFGERCGNADLCLVIANCELKLGYTCLPEGKLSQMTEMSRLVWERANLIGPANQPFVGKAAFAHKGGIHVSAVQRNAKTYEHIEPESVGNVRRVLISELSGRSNVLTKLSNRYPQLTDNDVIAKVLNEIQDRENEGYSYEAAEASFDLLVRRHVGQHRSLFDLQYYRVHGIGTHGGDNVLVEASCKLKIADEEYLCAAEGNGPIDALSHVLLQALCPAYEVLKGLQLVDYKVRVVNSADGTAAKVRVLIEHRFQHCRFSTLGVSENIIDASWNALVEACEFAVLSAEDR